ncbi:hypothetical protein AB0M43_38595 [Longispora sp. NPDC051575]|uniref:hypothetical protein n=1 Tax=Longispora sp. NPDC051575 TaxID=3154943 RepID=UPI0034461C35
MNDSPIRHFEDSLDPDRHLRQLAEAERRRAEPETIDLADLEMTPDLEMHSANENFNADVAQHLDTAAALAAVMGETTSLSVVDVAFIAAMEQPTLKGHEPSPDATSLTATTHEPHGRMPSAPSWRNHRPGQQEAEETPEVLDGREATRPASVAGAEFSLSGWWPTHGTSLPMRYAERTEVLAAQLNVAR